MLLLHPLLSLATLPPDPTSHGESLWNLFQLSSFKESAVSVWIDELCLASPGMFFFLFFFLLLFSERQC